MGSVGGWRVCLGQLGGGSKEDRIEFRSEIQRTISRLGGKVVGTVGPRTDVLLTSADDAMSETSAKVKKAWIHSKAVVSMDWLDECNARSTFVDTTPYSFPHPSSSSMHVASSAGTSATSTQKQASGTESAENHPTYMEKSPGGFKRTATSLSSGGGSKRHQADPAPKGTAKPAKIPVPTANKAPEGCPETTPRGAADPAAQVEGGILLPGWECLLTLPATTANDQNNYAMQIIVQGLGQGAGVEKSFVFVRWGFAGQRGSMCRLNGPYGTIAEAQNFFCKRFKDKTGVEWGSDANAQPGMSSKAHPHTIVFVPPEEHRAPEEQLGIKGLIDLILDRSVVDEVLKRAGLASKLVSDLKQRPMDMPTAPDFVRNDFMVSNLSPVDYQLSDCQQADMNDLPEPLPAFGVIAPAGPDAFGAQAMSGASPSSSKICHASSTDPQFTDQGNFTDQSSFGLPSASSSGRLLTSSGTSTPPMSFTPLRKAYKNIREISRILNLKANGEAGTNMDAEIARLSTEFYMVCLQRGGDEPTIDTREKCAQKMVQLAVLIEVVAKYSLSRDCIDSNGIATISYPDGVRTALTPIAKGSEPEILTRVLSGAQGMGEQQTNIAGMWAFSVSNILPFDGSTTMAYRPVEDPPSSASNLVWYPTTSFGLAAVFHSSTVAPFKVDPGGGQDDHQTFKSFGDAFKHITQCVDGLLAKNDIVLALLVEPQSTSPAGTASINGDVVVNPLNLPLIDHSLDAIILPLNNIVTTNGRFSSFEELPTILFGGTEYVSVDILKDFAGSSSIPNTPPTMLPPIVSATEHSMPMLGSSLRVAAGTGASSPSPTPSTTGRYVIRYVVAIRISEETAEKAKKESEESMLRTDSLPIAIADVELMQTLF